MTLIYVREGSMGSLDKLRGLWEDTRKSCICIGIGIGVIKLSSCLFLFFSHSSILLNSFSLFWSCSQGRVYCLSVRSEFLLTLGLVCVLRNTAFDWQRIDRFRSWGRLTIVKWVWRVYDGVRVLSSMCFDHEQKCLGPGLAQSGPLVSPVEELVFSWYGGS